MDTRTRLAGALFALPALACSDTDWARSTSAVAEGATSAVQLALTLPDGTVIRSLDYTVSGAGLTPSRSGTIRVEDSSAPVRFRVGNLPVAAGYRMALGGTSLDGKLCAGEASFNIADNLVSSLSMQLVCGAGVTVGTDDGGDVSASIAITNSAGVTCPVVTGISALPLQTSVGSSLELAGFTSSADSVQYAWSGAGGTFTSASSAATGFVCTNGGEHPLTFSAAKAGCASSSFAVAVSCTGVGPSPTPVPSPAPSPTPLPTPSPVGQPTPSPTPGTTPTPTPGVTPTPTPGVTPTPTVTPTPNPVPTPNPAIAARLRPLPNSAACETCLRTECSNYLNTDLVGPCFYGTASEFAVVDPAFAQACTDAFVCSITSTDRCGYNPNGPYECYCGVGVSIDACATNIGNVEGACVPEWTRAAACPAGNTDPICVLDYFTNLSQPIGFANFMFECMREACPASCGAGSPPGPTPTPVVTPTPTPVVTPTPTPVVTPTPTPTPSQAIANSQRLVGAAGAACEQCLQAECSRYLGVVDLVGPCVNTAPTELASVDSEFSRLCTEALACSIASRDDCGYNASGPYECYCGVNVGVDACFASIGNVRGACIPAWTAATRCPAGNTDPSCVLDFVTDLSKPSGFAYFMAECMRESCASSCPQSARP
jgi:hypothetical protein